MVEISYSNELEDSPDEWVYPASSFSESGTLSWQQVGYPFDYPEGGEYSFCIINHVPNSHPSYTLNAEVFFDTEKKKYTGILIVDINRLEDKNLHFNLLPKTPYGNSPEFFMAWCENAILHFDTFGCERTRIPHTLIFSCFTITDFHSGKGVNGEVMKEFFRNPRREDLF